MVLVAIVAMGAAACTNDQVESVSPTEEGVSFYAEFVNNDGTRAYIDDANGDKTWDTIWEQGDILQVSADAVQFYNFEYDSEKGKFTCNTEGVTSLVGQTVTISAYLGGNLDSKAGKKAWNCQGTQVDNFANSDEPVQLTANTSFLRYTYNGDGDVTFSIKVTDDRKVFVYDKVYYDEVTISGVKGENFVAFWTQSHGSVEATLSYSIDGVECKTANLSLASGKIYNLGTLEKVEVVETKTVYLVPDWWTTDDANFYAYYWFDGGDGNVLMTAEADDTYKAEIPLKATGMKFVRLNPAYDSFGWNSETITDRVWNETDDLVLPEGDKNYFYIQHNCWQVKDFVPVAATTKIYFYPDANWAQDGAWFAAKFGEEWKKLEDDAANTGYTVYSCEYTGDAQTVDFYRMDPAKTALSEDSKWNKKTGIAMPEGDKNCYYSTGWDQTGATAGYWAALPVVKTTTINVTAYNYSSWDASSIYLYAFATPNAAVAWPGVKMTAGSGKSMTATIEVKYFEGDKVTFIVNNNSGVQTANGEYDIASNIEFYFTDELILDEAPSVPNTHLYLKPNSNWTQGGARFAAYFYGNGERWVSMTDDDKDGIYEVEIPTDKSYPNVIFCRMNPGNANNNWDAKWDQTLDLTVPTYGPNVYVVKEGTWNLGGGEWVNFE